MENSPLEQIVAIAKDAGDVIMQVYASDDFEVETKDDGEFVSPLTTADKNANGVIEKGLRAISELPIVSEENSVRDTDGNFWLVDPLDGTKEFIKRTGEFTVNIALIEGYKPVLGVVYAPAIDRLYYADVADGRAYRRDGNDEPRQIQANAETDTPVIVTSKSHKDEQTHQLLDSLDVYDEKSMGSSLKLCMVAEGDAMLYPRLAPTSLWDTAAADAIVRAAGGRVTDVHDELLYYDPNRNILNPFFVVSSSNNSIRWQGILTD